MPQEFSMKTIARIHSDFAGKFGVPRQSGLVEALEARVQEAAGASAAVRSDDPAENIREFYLAQTGQSLSPGQETLLEKLLKEMEDA